MINYVTGGAVINTKSISRPFEICESAANVIVYNNLLSGNIKGGYCNLPEEWMTDEINLVS